MNPNPSLMLTIIWKSTTNFAQLYVAGVIDNNIGKLQREKSTLFSAVVLYASDLFSHSSRFLSFSFIESTSWGMYYTFNNNLSKFFYALSSGVGVAVSSFQI